MTFSREQGLWTYGAPAAAPPLAAVLELSGAVLEWTIDDPDAAPHITVTDLDAADWLWRVIGTDGHVRLVAAEEAPVEVTLDRGALAPLRRLALGHWMRRWWPASARDGIAALDPAVLDAEVAVLTAAAEEFFTEETFDSDVDTLLAGASSVPLAAREDPRVAVLLAACADLGDLAEGAPVARWRADYALVAGGDARQAPDVIASGVASMSWSAVPPGVFDAAEDTVTWSVSAAGASPQARVSAVLADAGSAHPLSEGIPVHLGSGEIAVAGALDSGGDATLALPLTESATWNHDWTATEVRIGVGAGETRDARERVRRFVRSRLAAPPADAFVAEVLAAEDDF